MATPKLFANRVIRKMINNAAPGSLRVRGDDFLAMRTVFRSLGGTWEGIMSGDPKALRILQQVVTGWCTTPKPKEPPI